MKKNVIVCGTLGVIAAGLGVLGYIKRNVLVKVFDGLKDRIVEVLMDDAGDNGTDV